MTEEQIVSLMMEIAEHSSHMYTCNRPPGAAGAMIVSEYAHAKVTAGVYPPEGSPTCKEVGCEIVYETDDIRDHVDKDDLAGLFHSHCARTIHAEQRAIAKAARIGMPTDGATIFSVLKPCYSCTKLIIAAGIKKIYYAGAAYDEDRTRKILENARVSCEKIDIGLGYGR